MSDRDNYWDNAPTESLWGSLKVGRLHGCKFETRRQAIDEVIDWLTFYNHRRLHSTLGYINPDAVRESLARGTVEEGRIMDRLRTTEYRGKVGAVKPGKEPHSRLLF